MTFPWLAGAGKDVESPCMRADFGPNLKRLRLAAGFTQASFAQAVGVQVRQVARWEKGEARPRMKYLAAMANVLGIAVDELANDPADTSEEPSGVVHPVLAEFLETDLGQTVTPAEKRRMMAQRHNGAPTVDSFMYMLLWFRSER